MTKPHQKDQLCPKFSYSVQFAYIFLFVINMLKTQTRYICIEDKQ